MTFRAWMMDQDWKDKELDKDILTYGTDIKLYSPSTCLFVPQYVNGILIDQKSSRGKDPKGVSYEESRRKYKASLCRYGKQKHLGRFSDPLKTYECYVKAKIIYIEEIAESFKDKDNKLMNALFNVALIMKIRYKEGKTI